MAEIVIGTVDDIPEGTAKVVQTGGKEIAVFNKNGEFYAMDNTCPHRGGPLADGDLTGDIVTCPLHSWQFDIKTGTCTLNPAIKLATYTVEIRDNELILIV